MQSLPQGVGSAQFGALPKIPEGLLEFEATRTCILLPAACVGGTAVVAWLIPGGARLSDKSEEGSEDSTLNARQVCLQTPFYSMEVRIAAA